MLDLVDFILNTIFCSHTNVSQTDFASQKFAFLSSHPHLQVSSKSRRPDAKNTFLDLTAAPTGLIGLSPFGAVFYAVKKHILHLCSDSLQFCSSSATLTYTITFCLWVKEK
jgi:hypothetical protein